jgi:hypothetical protein
MKKKKKNRSSQEANSHCKVRNTHMHKNLSDLLARMSNEGRIILIKEV